MNGFFVNDSKHDVNATVVGSLANKQKNKVTLANADLLADYTALSYQKSVLMVSTNTTGIL